MCTVCRRCHPQLLSGLQYFQVDQEGRIWATGPGGVHVFDANGQRVALLATGVKTGNVLLTDKYGVFVAADSQLLHLPWANQSAATQ